MFNYSSPIGSSVISHIHRYFVQFIAQTLQKIKFVLRTFVFKLSAVLLLPLLPGLNGIWWAEVTAEVASFLISFAFLAANRGRYQY